MLRVSIISLAILMALVAETNTLQTGEIPSFKLFESHKTLAFLDIGPLSQGHAVRSEQPPIMLLLTLYSLLFLSTTAPSWPIFLMTISARFW
jgi:hypothetical protein